MEILRQLLAVLFVLGLLGAAVWVLRRNGRAGWRGGFHRRREPGLLAAADRLALSPQHSLVLVRVAGRALLLAVYPAGCTLLESFAWQEVENAEPPRREAQ